MLVVFALLACTGETPVPEATPATEPAATAPAAPPPAAAEAAPAAPAEAVAAPAPTVAGRVFFVEPADGATVKSPVHVKFGIEGMTVAPAGSPDANSGHHHVLVDAAAIPAGTVVPKDDTHIHFGKGQTEADVTLLPGDHTLTLQLADGNHFSYGEAWSATIKLHVE